MNKKLRMIQLGVGPIGERIARFAAERASLDLVGAVDTDPELVGKDIGAIIEDDIERVIHRTEPEVVVHATGSSFPKVYDLLETVVSYGINIVSTCEELSYPFRRHPELARRLDTLACEHGASVSVSRSFDVAPTRESSDMWGSKNR